MPRSSDLTCPYALLGVSPEDDFATIRAAWVRLVKAYHPDVWYGSEDEATRRLMAVNDAYDTLAKTHKRTRATRAEEARQAQEEAEASRAKRSSPRAKRRTAETPRPKVQAVPARANRRSPVAGRFDAARSVFETREEKLFQAFA